LKRETFAYRPRRGWVYPPFLKRARTKRVTGRSRMAPINRIFTVLTALSRDRLRLWEARHEIRSRPSP
jgi:hypothetical protein